jgi:hypothetical protein
MESIFLSVRDLWRQHTVTRCIALAFIGGMLTSFRLWWKPALFPSLPLFAPLTNIPSGVSNVLAVALVLALAGMVLTTKRFAAIIALAAVVLLTLLDQMKWQPWVYLYLLLMLPLTIPGRSERLILFYWQLVIAGIYLWSGIHKINTNFVDGFFGRIMSNVFGASILEGGLAPYLGYCAGILESLAGVGLLFNRTRKPALIFAIAMHAAIVGYIVVHDHLQFNVVLVPWNLAMIAFNMLLFARFNSNAMACAKQLWKNKSRKLADAFPVGVVLVFVWILPVFNFTGHVDHYLSFSLFSNKPSSFYVAVRDDQLGKVPALVRKHTVNIAGLSGGQIIDVDAWARDELGVPFYPERRVFTKLSSFFCALGAEEGSIVFLEVKQHGKEKKIDHFGCGE